MDMGISFEKLKHPSQSPLSLFRLVEDPVQTCPNQTVPIVRSAGQSRSSLLKKKNEQTLPQILRDRHKFATFACVYGHVRWGLNREDAMRNRDNTNQNGEYDKWAAWTMNPPRDATPLIRCTSALLFVLAAGLHIVGFVA